MPVVLVQHSIDFEINPPSGSSYVMSIPFPGASTIGNVIVVWAAQQGNGRPGEVVTDSAGNTYQTYAQDGPQNACVAWFAEVTHAGPTPLRITADVTAGPGPDLYTLAIAEFSGVPLPPTKVQLSTDNVSFVDFLLNNSAPSVNPCVVDITLYVRTNPTVLLACIFWSADAFSWFCANSSFVPTAGLIRIDQGANPCDGGGQPTGVNLTALSDAYQPVYSAGPFTVGFTVDMNLGSGPPNIFIFALGASSAEAPTLSLACPASSASIGAPYSHSLVATGGTPAYMFAIIAGSLPAG